MYHIHELLIMFFVILCHDDALVNVVIARDHQVYQMRILEHTSYCMH